MVFKENHFKYEIKVIVYQGNDHNACVSGVSSHESAVVEHLD